jgi:hypothetical protein
MMIPQVGDFGLVEEYRSDFALYRELVVATFLHYFWFLIATREGGYSENAAATAAH